MESFLSDLSIKCGVKSLGVAIYEMLSSKYDVPCGADVLYECG